MKPMAIARRPTRKSSLRSERNDSGAMAEILSESCTEFMRLWRRSFCLRQMYDDPEWLIGQELSRPSNDEFLYIVVEFLFAERKRIETMKELGDFFDPNLDRIRGSRRICVAIRCMPHRLHDLGARTGVRHVRAGYPLPS